MLRIRYILVNIQWSQMEQHMLLSHFILRIRNVEQTLAIHTEMCNSSIFTQIWLTAFMFLPTKCLFKTCRENKPAGRINTVQVNLYWSYLVALYWKYWCPGKVRWRFAIKHYLLCYYMLCKLWFSWRSVRLIRIIEGVYEKGMRFMLEFSTEATLYFGKEVERKLSTHCTIIPL